MKGKRKESELEDEMRPEYDLRKRKFVGRGIYAERYRSGTNLVLLEPDVREAFPDDESVNEALRVIAKAAKDESLQLERAQRRFGVSHHKPDQAKPELHERTRTINL